MVANCELVGGTAVVAETTLVHAAISADSKDDELEMKTAIALV